MAPRYFGACNWRLSLTDSRSLAQGRKGRKRDETDALARAARVGSGGTRVQLPLRFFLVTKRLVAQVIEPDVDTRHQTDAGALVNGHAVLERRRGTASPASPMTTTPETLPDSDSSWNFLSVAVSWKTMSNLKP